MSKNPPPEYLRDVYAAVALHALLEKWFSKDNLHETARLAYKVADLMLDERRS